MSQRIIENKTDDHSSKSGCTPYNTRNYLDPKDTAVYLAKLKTRHEQYLEDFKKVSGSGINPFDSLRSALKSNFRSSGSRDVWKD